ncbi:unnamed protein product [Alternaria alternata]
MSLGPIRLPGFNYEPLPARCIRVLELQPGERRDPFQGRFTVISIDGGDKYDALSYMWGDASPVDHIVVDGAAIPIAWNLARALEYLRDQQGSEVQNERGHQVAMMRSVYSKADCVRIWINVPDLEEESKAVAAFKNFEFGTKESKFGLGDDLNFWEPLKPIFSTITGIDSGYNELFTTCATDSVDMTHMRLRVRGMKVGEVQTVLSLPFDGVGSFDGMTVAQFWSSSLGQHIGSYFCHEERQIPLEMVRALRNPRSKKDFDYEDAIFGLKWFYDCSTKPDLADQHIGALGLTTNALLAPLHDHPNYGAAANAVSHIIIELTRRKGILTDKDQFGLVSECNIRAGDEIWMLLGHSIPSVLRKQPDGTYEHICTARIPVLMDSIIGHTDIRRFSRKAAPGEQIGEWTIEDIELV